MITLNLVQGTNEWHEHRAERDILNASEAPAMLGLGKNLKRSSLLKYKATGLEQEYSDFVLSLFNEGHEAEAKFRPEAEKLVGDELFPVTGMIELDGMRLSASFDGINFDETIIFEHKLYNFGLAEYIRDKMDLPDTHWPQVEHQLLVSQAEKCLFVTSDGTLHGDCAVLDYVSKPERRQRVIDGWKQFQRDLAAYEHVEVTPPAEAAPIESLPSLFVQVEGKVLSSNLDSFKAAASAMIAKIKTDLQTDQDFADAEAMTKHLKQGEERLEQAKSAAIAQTASIDALFRTVDQISSEMRQKRLQLKKLVKAQKENIKEGLVLKARAELRAFEDELNATLCDGLLDYRQVNFADAIKGKKLLSSMQDAVSDMLSSSKIDAQQHASRIAGMLKALDTHGARHLFPDIRAIAKDPPEPSIFLESIEYRKAEEKRREQAAIQAAIDAQKAEDERKVSETTSEVVEAPKVATKLQVKSAEIETADGNMVREFMKLRGLDDSRIRSILIEFTKYMKGVRQNQEVAA